MHGITRLEVLEEPAQQAAVVDRLFGFHADELHMAAEAARHVGGDVANGVDHAHLDAGRARVDGAVEEAGALSLQLAQRAAARPGESRGQPPTDRACGHAGAVVEPRGDLGLEPVAPPILDGLNFFLGYINSA